VCGGLLVCGDAWALPGPEVLAPLAAGLLQLVALGWAALAAGGARGRGTLRRFAPALGLVALIWALLGPKGAALIAAASWIVWRRRWGLGLLLVGWFVFRNLGVGHPLPPMPDLLGAGSIPAGAVVHLGEREDFENCRATGGYLLRPADLPAAQADGALAEARVLVAEGGELAAAPAGARPARDVLSDTADCYIPPGLVLWRMILPRPALRPALLQRGVVRLTQVPLLRPKDAAALPPEVGRIEADEVLATPTGDLPARFGALEGAVWIAGERLEDLKAAARLAAEAGASVVGVSRVAGEVTEVGEPLTPSGLAGLAAALVLSCGALDGVARRLRDRRLAAALTRGRAPGPWLGVVSGLMAPTVAVGGGVWIAAQPVGLALAWLAVSPLIRAPWWASVLGLAASLAAFGLRAREAPPGERAGPLVFGAGLGAAALLVGLDGPLGLVAAGALPALLLPPLVRLGLRARWRAGVAAGRAGAAPLERAAGLEAVGWKAARLGRAALESPAVPPGWVVTGDGAPGLPEIPLLVRSSALDEDASCGRYLSLALPGDSGQRRSALAAALARVRGGYSGGSALVMPLLEAARGGAGVWDGAALVIESGPGRDAVTAGRAVTGRARIGLRSGEVRRDGQAPSAEALRRFVWDVQSAAGEGSWSLEWLECGGRLWLVQLHPLAGPAGWQAAALAALGPLAEAPGVLLESVDDGALSAPAAPETLALWADCWTRAGALGDALVLLGIPRVLAPERAVIAAGGRLFSVVPAAGRLGLLLQLRAGLPGWDAGRLAARIAREGRDDLRGVAARSLALRLLQGLLPEGAPPPEGPGARLARALAAGAVPAALGHRGRYDLDPASPRYGARPAAPLEPPQYPERLDAGWCALARDVLHDRLAWIVSGMDAPEAVLAGEVAPSGRFGLTALEGLAEVEQPGAAWVSGQGPIEGTLTWDASTPSPDRILVMERADPALLRPGWAAVVSRTGGRLSHAAFVARQLGVPALFGVGEVALEEGKVVHLSTAGEVAAAPESDAPTP
jgi:phosphohistidine swiveling domain-containing protein